MPHDFWAKFRKSWSKCEAMKRVYFSGVVWVLFTISHRPLSWSSLYSLLLDSRRVSTKRDGLSIPIGTTNKVQIF